MSGGCDRQKTDEDEISEARDVRLRRDRDEALQKASKAIAALVAAREDLEKARSERDEARLILPWFVRCAFPLRLLPVAWFDALMGFFGITKSMDAFTGRKH